MSKRPTAKQQKFVKELVKNGGNGAAAARAAYKTKSPTQSAAVAHNNLQKPKIQTMLKEELARQGITIERALSPISKALGATTTSSSGEQVDDLDTQLKGSDRALKLLLPDLKDNDSTSINAEVKSITINIKNYER